MYHNRISLNNQHLFNKIKYMNNNIIFSIFSKKVIKFSFEKNNIKDPYLFDSLFLSCISGNKFNDCTFLDFSA